MSGDAQHGSTAPQQDGATKAGTAPPQPQQQQPHPQQQQHNSWTRAEIAARLAADIPDGTYMNLGIGLPTLVSNYLPSDREVILHTENGMLGMGPEAGPGHIDPDLINAGKIPVTELPGASYFHHGDSFGMMRGGHLDLCVLGAFQVSEHGDLANWSTGAPDAIPAVGGAMDLAIGAKSVYVMMELASKKGVPKLVDTCSYPLTGIRCVDRLYTDRAIFELGDDGATVLEMVGSTTLDELREITGLTLHDGTKRARTEPASTTSTSTSTSTSTPTNTTSTERTLG